MSYGIGLVTQSGRLMAPYTKGETIQDALIPALKLTFGKDRKGFDRLKDLPVEDENQVKEMLSTPVISGLHLIDNLNEKARIVDFSKLPVIYTTGPLPITFGKKLDNVPTDGYVAIFTQYREIQDAFKGDLGTVIEKYVDEVKTIDEYVAGLAVFNTMFQEMLSGQIYGYKNLLDRTVISVLVDVPKEIPSNKVLFAPFFFAPANLCIFIDKELEFSFRKALSRFSQLVAEKSLKEIYAKLLN